MTIVLSAVSAEAAGSMGKRVPVLWPGRCVRGSRGGGEEAILQAGCFKHTGGKMLAKIISKGWVI